MVNNAEQDNRIEKVAILELLKTARTMKRQLKILKGMQLCAEERSLLKKVLESVEDDCNLFRI